MRYVVAVTIAMVVIGLGILFVRSTSAMIRQQMATAPVASTDSNEEQPETDGFVGMEMTETQMLRISIANVLARFGGILSVLAIVVACTIAAKMGR